MDSKKIKKMLIDKELTIGKLAKEIGYSRARLSQIINSKGAPCPPRTEKLLAHALGCTHEDVS
jgi:DNA-binding Xre family transcriptional regulator